MSVRTKRLGDDTDVYLVMCPGITTDELLRQIRQRNVWRGLPILPVGHAAKIIRISGRWEPDIEDTP